MSRPSVRVLRGGAIALAAFGAALLYYGDSLRRVAADDLREASFRSVSRTRALDQLAASDPADAAMVDRWLSDARGDAERGALRALRDCLSSAESDCASMLDEARAHYASDLQDRWSAASEQNERADIALLLALVAFLGGIALALSTSRQPAPLAVEEPEPPVANPAVEALLKQRLEDLYAARLRAFESERFAAYGELAAGLSHGLKTPLASIRAAAQVAVRRLGDEHPATPQLRDVIAEVDGLVEQVKRFLQATGSRDPIPTRVAPAQLLAAIGSGYASEAAERGVTLDSAVAEGLGEVLVDAALLEMALRNLVENAMAVAPRGSTVVVSARPATPPSRVGLDDVAPVGDQWIEIVVSDEGPGIPREVLESGHVESKKPDGSGLGLAIARRIAARHGGALVVDTGAGSGTSVRTVLPVAAAEAPA